MKIPQNVGRVSKKVIFFMCGSCYWAASYLDGKITERCLSCNSANIDSMPVAGDEVYVYDYDTRRGIVVDFTTLKK
jgi:hypothetical protein